MADILLEATGLDKVYGEGDTATHALRDVSFALAEGEFASIVGQSGSGKSTLLNLLGLLDTPTHGSIVYRGQDIGALGKPALAKLRNSLVGFVFQFHHLLPEFSVIENVLMPALIGGKPVAEARRLAEETLSMLGLNGLEDKGANQLSGGQKQRVAIARALMNRPALLLADEPTATSTPSTRAGLQALPPGGHGDRNRVPHRHARPRCCSADRPYPRSTRRRTRTGCAQRVRGSGAVGAIEDRQAETRDTSLQAISIAHR